MYLKKFLYVNWGNIPALEFDFGPINLLSGGNGSGKTTAADAIQTIMTAAHDTLFMFNPGQDEATQRGRNKQVRTLASYVLGCDDGSYARPEGAVGYLGAVFYPTEGETASPFTALIGVSASLDRAGTQVVARQNDMQFFICPAEELALDDLVKTDATGGKQVVSMDALTKQVRKRCGVDAIEKYDTKRQYLRRLYGALRGRRDGVTEAEALNAARAFSRFMAYKPVKSINGFVAHEILEPKNLGEAIRSISELMKTIYAMESEATRLKETAGILESTRAKSDAYIEQWIEHHVLEYLAARSRYLKEQKAYLDTKEQQKNIREAIDQSRKDRELAARRRDQLHEQLVNIEAQRKGIGALQAKDEYEKQIRSNTDKLHALVPKLLEQVKSLEGAAQANRSIQQLLSQSSLSADIPELGQRSLLTQVKAVIAKSEQEQIDFPRLLGKDLAGLAALEDHLDTALVSQKQLNQWRDTWFNHEQSRTGMSLRDQVARLVEQRDQKLQGIRRQVAVKQADIDSLSTMQVNYPAYTRAAIEAIRRECPQADPRVLCDYIEVIDPDWQSALEGYIGGARFSIIVEPEFEAEAIRIVRSMPGRDNRARVVQGSKARSDAERMKVPANSIVHLMEFNHAVVKGYITATYGSVEQVRDAQALTQTRRGVTAAGMGSGGYSMFRCDLPDSELVFGKGARERALAAKKAELNQLAVQANEADQSIIEARDLLSAINQLPHLVFADYMQSMLECHRSIQTGEQALEMLDLSDFESLEIEFNRLRQQQQELDQSISSLDKETGEQENRLKTISRRCEDLADQQDETLTVVETREEDLRNIKTVWPEFDADARLISADEEAKDVTQEFVDNQVLAIAAELNSKAHEIERNILEHNQRCTPGDAIVYQPDYALGHNQTFFKGICMVRREADQVHNRLKNNILVDKLDKLVGLKEDFNNAFVTNLCHSIYQSINDGKRILENLNKELEHHRFGADRESYRFGWEWVPEYKEYWTFFKEIINDPSLGESNTLFSSSLSDKSKKIRDQLMSMLLDEDEQKAMRELERISDYRNYRNYEIYKQPEGKEPIALSQYGTGSGGQLETPAYIIRSAAITSAFRFSEGDSHLRMVLVDEAFSKMDETRSKEVINYLTETLGLQLLFIMPTSKSGPFMDLISNQFVFTKVPLPAGQKTGELATRVLVDRQKCNQDKIRELWANHRRIVMHQGELDFMEEFA
ncbi:ATP-binding protein [Gynuella sp.]|uniref:ATP-binding protein n=1 Tax=Gynuella sp. TaxID=2969146 RepID=UPI003D096531